MTSPWIAETIFRSPSARAFGETPEEAVKLLIDTLQDHWNRTNSGDPSKILAWRENIRIAPCESGTGYVIGSSDSFWRDVTLDASDPRFDGLFELQSVPAPNV